MNSPVEDIWWWRAHLVELPIYRCSIGTKCSYSQSSSFQSDYSLPNTVIDVTTAKHTWWEKGHCLLGRRKNSSCHNHEGMCSKRWFHCFIYTLLKTLNSLLMSPTSTNPINLPVDENIKPDFNFISSKRKQTFCLKSSLRSISLVISSMISVWIPLYASVKWV